MAAKHHVYLYLTATEKLEKGFGFGLTHCPRGACPVLALARRGAGGGGHSAVRLCVFASEFSNIVVCTKPAFAWKSCGTSAGIQSNA